MRPAGPGATTENIGEYSTEEQRSGRDAALAECRRDLRLGLLDPPRPEAELVDAEALDLRFECRRGDIKSGGGAGGA